MKSISIPLGDIKLHPAFKQPEVVEHLITTEFVLKEPQKLFCPEIVPYILELHPIQVISGKNDKYFCVGGLRSLSIIRQLLLPSAMITVAHLAKMEDEAVLSRCLIDILVSASCFSLRSKGSIHKTIQYIRENIRDELLTTKAGPSRIAKMLQVNPETVRLWNKRTKKIL
jgi:hypothetical protein